MIISIFKLIDARLGVLLLMVPFVFLPLLFFLFFFMLLFGNMKGWETRRKLIIYPQFSFYAQFGCWERKRNKSRSDKFSLKWSLSFFLLCTALLLRKKSKGNKIDNLDLKTNSSDGLKLFAILTIMLYCLIWNHNI